MFRRKTLFVVGAGASKELPPFPDARGLTETVADMLTNSARAEPDLDPSGHGRLARALQQRAQEKGEDFNDYRNAALKVARGMPIAASIDNYLDAHRDNPRMQLAGKLAIVQAILDAEAGCPLFYQRQKGEFEFDPKQVNCWLPSFLELLVTGIERNDIASLFDNVAFIIFNYDRCVEHYLCEMLARYYDVGTDAIGSLINRSRFVHPYGTVGELPWQVGVNPFTHAPNRNDAVPFGDNNAPIS